MKKNIVIIVLAVLVICLGGYLIYDKLNDSKEPKEDNKTLINNAEEDDSIKEEIEQFLSPLVGFNPTYNLLKNYNNNSDESVFSKVITYLVANNEYQKSGDVYTFSQNKIKDIARKYFMRNDFTYITNNSQFTYDSDNKTFSSTLQFGMFETGNKMDKKVKDYIVNNNEITVNYNVVFETNGYSVDYDETYEIIIEKVNNELIIKSITKK